MKRIMKLAVCLAFLVGLANAQTTTVTGTVADTSSTAWGYAQVIETFVPLPGYSGNYTWQGQSYKNFPVVSTTANSSGVFSLSVQDNTQITPYGSGWSTTVCPLASVKCITIPGFSISGASMSITSQIAPYLLPPVVNPTGVQQAYSNSEVAGAPGCGQIYYNTTSFTTYQWNCSTSSWAQIGGSGGTITAGVQYSLTCYTATGTASTLGPCNITTDSTFNNLYLPGGLTVDGAPPTISANTGVLSFGSGILYLSTIGPTNGTQGGFNIINQVPDGLYYVSFSADYNGDTGSRCGNSLVNNVTSCATYTTSSGFTSIAYFTNGNCSSAASPAVCGSSSAGSVVVAASATSVVVDTTRVTANSQILLTFDSSLGSKLGVTCNTTSSVPTVTARTSGTSFTLTTTAPTTNPACFSYSIIN